MYTIENFRKRFKQVREKACFPKRLLSQELEKGGMYITKVEKGEIDITMTDFLRVCELLKVSPLVFFDLERGDFIMEYEYLKKKAENLPERMKGFLNLYFKHGRP